jgi:tetratricopeptide (TPR) repeat protein
MLLVCLMVTLWCLSTRSDDIAFLPREKGAEWIVYPKPAEGGRQRAGAISAVFQRSVALKARPAEAVLSLRSFGSAAVIVNEQAVPLPRTSAAHWKSPRSVNVSNMLQPGTNVLTVWVTNTVGPPALWFLMQTEQGPLGTDEEWQVSLAGASWQNARDATRSPEFGPDNAMQETENPWASLKRVWPALGILSVIALGLLLFIEVVWRKQPPSGRTLNKLTGVLLIFVMLMRAALLVHNAPLLPRSMGFDAEAHEQYVQFIQEKHALPLAKDGWEMYQPPLYYAAGALLLSGFGYAMAEDNAVILLRSINGVAALVHCWLALLCLRLLFPKNIDAQAVGLLVTAFLPPHLYLAQYVTNEPLAGLFVTAAFYSLLRAIQACSIGWLIGIGIGLGAAMLTKFSSLLVIPIFLIALAIQLLSHKVNLVRHWWRNIGTVLGSCLLICGWHYGRVWAVFGKPIVGNWEANSAFAWWQDPGFRTWAFYWSFGRVLICPLFSALHSFADGFYSTLWGDGLASGAARSAFRPPWNYDFMNAGYVLALALSALFLVGLVIAVVRLIRRFEAQWLVVIGMLAVFGFGILYMSLQVPAYAQVKAFYAFPAIVPFSAVMAMGWSWLVQKHFIFRTGLWILMLIWTFTACAAFGILNGDPAVQLVRGMFLADRGRDAEALESLSDALQHDQAAVHAGERSLSGSDRAEAHFHLGLVLDRAGRSVEAARHYREALRYHRDFPRALNNLAWILASSPLDEVRDGAEAVRLAERACELTHELTTAYIGTLGAAYAEAGRFGEAITTAQKAIDRARLRNEPDLAEKNQHLLEIYRAGKPFREQE